MSTSRFNISVCSAATPLTAKPIKQARGAILILPSLIISNSPRASDAAPSNLIPREISSRSSRRCILTIAEYTFGISFLTSSSSHSSSASRITVWFVYANSFDAISNAASKSIPRSSSRTISSGIASTGCVSFSCITASSCSRLRSPFLSAPRTRSRIDALVRKYC